MTQAFDGVIQSEKRNFDGTVRSVRNFDGTIIKYHFYNGKVVGFLEYLGLNAHFHTQSGMQVGEMAQNMTISGSFFSSSSMVVLNDHIFRTISPSLVFTSQSAMQARMSDYMVGGSIVFNSNLVMSAQMIDSVSASAVIIFPDIDMEATITATVPYFLNYYDGSLVSAMDASLLSALDSIEV